MLFSDIEGSTQLLQQLGEDYGTLLTHCRQVLRMAFQQHHGHEVDTQGDSIFVAFARASDAVLAAVEAQRALASQQWPQGLVVRVRMGLHTGEPQLSTEGYVGVDVHSAARIMSAAHGGQVLLSQTTRDLTEHDLADAVSLRDLGAHRLKDFPRRVHLYQLVSADLPQEFPPLRTLDSYANHLPIPLTRLIGREREVAMVLRLLQQQGVRLLTLTGAGGTGKTRLALQAAAELSDRFPHGVYFVNLAPISDPALVVPTIAQTLEVKEITGQPLLDLLKTFLRDKQLLLLLDNFEQVVDAAPCVTDLLAACPQLRVLVTSREVLHVQGEQEFVVPPLVVPDPTHLPDLVTLSQYEAVALFISRAQAVKADFRVTNANAPAVAEICTRLDGLPLAIELAAARSKLLPPQALLARLGSRLAVLTSGAKDVPARQQTLRNTIAWSYNLLPPNEQRLFRRISYSFAGCTLEAAEAICTEPGEGEEQVLNGVASLIDKSLLQQTEEEGQPRLVMLETVREYALERLAASGDEMEKIWQAHALYYLELAEQAVSELRGPQQAVWLQRLEIEHDNLRAVQRWVLEGWEKWQHGEMALRLGGALERFWQMRSHFTEGRGFLERALAGSEGVLAPIRAKVLRAAGSMALYQGDTTSAEAFSQESLALFQELEDKRGMVSSLNILGDVARTKGKNAAARAMHEEALALSREAADRQCIAESLLNIASYNNLTERGRALGEESLKISRELGDVWMIAITLLYLAGQSLVEREFAASLSLAEEGLALCQEVGNRDGIALGTYLKGWLALRQGDHTRARSLFEESLAISKELGDRRSSAFLLVILRQMAVNAGDHEKVLALQKESKAIYKELAMWRRAGSSPNALKWTAFKQSMDRPGQALAAQEQMAISAAQSPTPPAAKPAPYPDGLTAREVEVLRLVAQGLSDAQIAERLVISPRTVNTHLTSIYGKIQVPSRSAATRYAIEHHL